MACQNSKMLIVASDIMANLEKCHPSSPHGECVGNICAKNPSPEHPEISNIPGTPSVPTSDPDVHGEDQAKGNCEQTGGSTGQEHGEEEVRVRELKHDGSELARCDPAPSQSLWSLVGDVKMTDVTDWFEDPFDVLGKHEKDEHPSDVFTRPASPAAKCKLVPQISVPCAGDEKPAHITVLQWMESGLVVGVDEANGCLKAFDLTSSTTFKLVEGIGPIGLCSAGPGILMVSCIGCRLAVYAVRGHNTRLINDIKTDHQYYGLVSIPYNSMVAASCPSTRSVDVLNCHGLVHLRLRAVDFVNGPYMIGATKDGELLAVDHPQDAPTTIVCFGLDDQVKWKYPVSSSLKHVTCSQLVGAENGDIYFAVQNDSLVYRLQRTERGWIDGPVSNSGKAIDFQHLSALAFTEKGHMIVPRNVPIGEGETTTFRTVSVDVYTQWSQSTPDTAGITDLGADGDGSLYVFSREVGGKKIA